MQKYWNKPFRTFCDTNLHWEEAPQAYIGIYFWRYALAIRTACMHWSLDTLEHSPKRSCLTRLRLGKGTLACTANYVFVLPLVFSKVKQREQNWISSKKSSKTYPNTQPLVLGAVGLRKYDTYVYDGDEAGRGGQLSSVWHWEHKNYFKYKKYCDLHQI